MLFILFLIGLVAQVRAITLLQALQSYSQLSSLSAYINSSSSSTNLLSTANNFTFLAPSNAAIASYLTANPNVLTPDLLAATVQYALLKGEYPSLSFTEQPVFVASYLSNASYANVTGGQRMGLLKNGESGMVELFSGNKSVGISAGADILCTGGIIHILDTVPLIPLPTVSEITAANLTYTTSILSTGNYLNTANTYVNDILSLPDVTYFIPNSLSALEDLQALVKNSSAEQLQANFEYHFVKGWVGYSSGLVDGMQLKTVEGGNLTLKVEGGETFVNAAKIIASDYLVANGVVHVIDSLLSPNNTAGPPTSTSTSNSPLSPPPTSSPSSSTANNGQLSPISDTKSLPSSNSPSPKTTIGIAIGVSVFVVLLIAIVTFFLVRRSRSLVIARQREDALTAAGSNFSRSGSGSGSGASSFRSAGGSGKGIFVQRSVEFMREGAGVPWELKATANSGNMGTGYGGYGGYGSQECIAGPPYIPPRSPERAFGSVRREFF